MTWMTCAIGVSGLIITGGFIGFILSLWNDEKNHRQMKAYHQSRTREEYQRGFEFAAALCKLKSKQPDVHQKVIHLLTSGETISEAREQQIVLEAR